MGTVFVDNLEPQSGTTLTLGASGDTVKVASGVTNNVGIGMADQWRLTADTSGNGDVTANWERNDESNFNYIGTGLSESSGIFSFPSTGIYLIIFSASFTKDSSDVSCEVSIQTTTDNSSYNPYAFLYLSQSGNGLATFGLTCTAIIDVTNTTTHKFKFTKSSFSGSTTLGGDTDYNQTHFTAIRLGDT